MAFVGMDTDLATSQAATLNSQGVDGVQALISQLDSLVAQISDNWKGTDSANFASEWTSSHRTNLMNVHSALVDFHTRFNQNIQEQIATSAS